MGRKHRTRMLRRANQTNTSTSIQYIVVLFFMGMAVAYETKQIQDDLFSTLVFLVFLIAINVGLFRYMELHQAFKRTHRIQYWKFKQKCIFGLYLFLTVLMIGATHSYGRFLYLAFFLVLLYIGFISGWKSYKNFNAALPPAIDGKRYKIHHMNIEEIDKMEGTEFELFLSKLYDGMGYYAEVTPHNDYGIDVIIIMDKIKTGIQAKCYGEGRTIGVEAVNEVCGGAGYWKVQKKMVITNRYFSKKALITAESNNIEMIDRDGLQLLLKAYQKMRDHRSIFSFFSFLNSR